MPKPAKKPATVSKDILGMFGIATKRASRPGIMKQEKPAVTEVIPKIIKPSIPAITELIPASSVPGMFESPLAEAGPTLAADQKWKNYLPSDIAPAIYKRGIRGCYICRNCGRGFEGHPIIINYDPERKDKWNVQICPLCGEYGLVECGETAVIPALEACVRSSEAHRKIDPNVKPFIIGNPNVKWLEYAKDPLVFFIWEPCDVCGGKGKYPMPTGEMEQCWKCDGKKAIKNANRQI